MVKYDKSDLWILGDSFTESNSDGNYWTDILIKQFNGENRYLNAGPGRDIQTTMDLFYKNIHNISDTSLVLIFLPTVARLRYPKKKEHFNEFLEAETEGRVKIAKVEFMEHNKNTAIYE